MGHNLDTAINRTVPFGKRGFNIALVREIEAAENKNNTLPRLKLLVVANRLMASYIKLTGRARFSN